MIPASYWHPSLLLVGKGTAHEGASGCRYVRAVNHVVRWGTSWLHRRHCWQVFRLVFLVVGAASGSCCGRWRQGAVSMWGGV
jgi:hypothetical protein